MEAAFLIPLLPLVGFVALLVVGRRLGDPWAGWLATAACAGAFIATLVVFVDLTGEHHDHRAFTQHLFDWISVGGLDVDAALLIDPLSVTMALFVTGVGSLIHLYSIGYM
ncbi:MAG: NADH-quinone oxidoreductase subunit L, partial [Acidimicrobiales bacterium]